MTDTTTAFDDLIARLRDLGLDEQLSGELGAVHAELEATVAQLAQANEELAASSTDLETTAVELERAADELRAVTVEVEERSADVERVTAYLQSVIDAVDGAVVVVDVDQKVRAWSAGATDRWGAARSATLGKALGRLDLAGENIDLAAAARAVLGGEAPDPAPLGDDGTIVRAHALLGADGSLDGAVVVVVGA